MQDENRCFAACICFNNEDAKFEFDDAYNILDEMFNLFRLNKDFWWIFLPKLGFTAQKNIRAYIVFYQRNV